MCFIYIKVKHSLIIHAWNLLKSLIIYPYIKILLFIIIFFINYNHKLILWEPSLFSLSRTRSFTHEVVFIQQNPSSFCWFFLSLQLFWLHLIKKKNFSVFPLWIFFKVFSLIFIKATLFLFNINISLIYNWINNY